MATYRVEIDGTVYKIAGDRPPTEKEARDAISSFSGSSVEKDVVSNKEKPSLRNPIAPEELMASRGNYIKDIQQNPLTMKHPIGSALRVAGAGLDVLEGIPASIGLDLQAGNIKNIPSNIGKVVAGQRVPQRGDIMRAIGTPEGVASTVGLVSGGAKLAPETMATNALGSMVGKVALKTGLPQLVSRV